MKRDLKSAVDAAHSLPPLLRTASGTGDGVDLRGYDSAFGLTHFGDWTDGTWTPKLQESDDNTSFTDVGTADLQGAFTAVSGTSGENTLQRVGYIGAKRYLRGFLTGTGTTGINAGIAILRGHPARQPLA
jgi:hypothetical protein